MVVYNKLEYLTDDTERVSRQFLGILAAHLLHPVVSETYRSKERQNSLYTASQKLKAQGLSELTKTNESWHEPGRALDIKIRPATPQNILFFLETARSLGFRTIPSQDSIDALRQAITDNPTDPDISGIDLWDWGHVEFRNGRTWSQAMQEYALLPRAPQQPAQSTGLASLIPGSSGGSPLGMMSIVTALASVFSKKRS